MTRRAGLDPEIVLRAAIEIADRQGLEALTLAELAERLNVRTPSLYNHIAGLPGLHRELALRGLQEMNHRLGRAAVGKTGGAGVAALAEAYRAFIKEHPGLYASTVQSVHHPDRADPELLGAGQETMEIVLAVLEAYNLDQEAALHAVRALRSLVHGFASLEVAGGFGLPLNIDESFRRLVGLLLEGLANRCLD